MRIIIHYDDGYSLLYTSSTLVPSLRPEITFRVILNRSSNDYTFKDTKTVFIDNPSLKTKEDNILKFKIISPNEKKKGKEAVKKTLSDFIYFLGRVLYSVFTGSTPAVRRGRSLSVPTSVTFKDLSNRETIEIKERRVFTKYKFQYAEDSDFVLILSPVKCFFTLAPKSTKQFDENE